MHIFDILPVHATSRVIHILKQLLKRSTNFEFDRSQADL